ncbi:MAG TPA: hypothetical protein VN436_03125 [Holophaga sp.]|nr:hypothetical protein [Holophaga sp.]
MPRPLWRDGDQVTQADFDSLREDREKLSARVAELEAENRRLDSIVHGQDGARVLLERERIATLIDESKVFWLADKYGVYARPRILDAITPKP